jgi:hypothetical protein
MTRKKPGPPMVFDGQIFWYVSWFDLDDDRCCAPLCRKLIDEDDVPLILFKGEGKAVQQSRIHVACAEQLGLFKNLRP